MKEFNWQDIKKIVDGFTGKALPPKPKIKPIFAHASQDFVTFSLKSYLFFDLEETMDQYSYVVTLIEKQGRYHATTRAYLNSEVGEHPVLFEEETFSKSEDEKGALTRFMRQPFNIFKRAKHIRVMTFKNSNMAEEDFNNLIELWRNNQQIQN